MESMACRTKSLTRATKYLGVSGWLSSITLATSTNCSSVLTSVDDCSKTIPWRLKYATSSFLSENSTSVCVSVENGQGSDCHKNGVSVAATRQIVDGSLFSPRQIECSNQAAEKTKNVASAVLDPENAMIAEAESPIIIIVTVKFRRAIRQGTASPASTVICKPKRLGSPINPLERPDGSVKNPPSPSNRHATFSKTPASPAASEMPSAIVAARRAY